MFKVELKADIFKNIINIISTVVDEVKLSVTPESISIKAIDPTHVAMINITVEKEAFESFEADDTEIGLDLEKIKSVFKLVGSGDIIAMEHDADQGMLTMTIGNLVRRMALVETGGLPDPKVPQIDLPVNAKLSLDQLQKGIRAAETIGDADHVKIEIDATGFGLSCSGDTDLASLKVPASELESLEADHLAQSTYPRDYFSNIVKVIPAGFVEVMLESDLPVKLLFELAEGHAHVTYLLAPRIENE